MSKKIVIVFSYEGLMLDEMGKFFKPSSTENIEGCVDIEVPQDPEIQFYGPMAGYQKIYIGVLNIMSLFGRDVKIKPYEKFNDFELRVLELAVKQGLITFDSAKYVLSLEDNDEVNSNIQPSIPPRTVRKHITGSGVVIPEDAACLVAEKKGVFDKSTKDSNGFDDNSDFAKWSKRSKEVEGFSW